MLLKARAKHKAGVQQGLKYNQLSAGGQAVIPAAGLREPWGGVLLFYVVHQTFAALLSGSVNTPTYRKVASI